jgi:hypothetical protein
MQFDESEIKQIEEIAARSARHVLSEAKPMASQPDDDTREQIRQFQLLAHKPYLNKRECALYLGVSERSIEEWSLRPPDENPFPAGSCGTHLRAKRERVDEWVINERK